MIFLRRLAVQESRMRKIQFRKRTLLATTFGAAALAAIPISLQWSPSKTPSLSLSTANARVGRPLTPGSIAGVNRRVDRRAARRGYYGAGVGGGYYGAGVGRGLVGAGVLGAAAAGGYYGGTPYFGGGYQGLYSYSPAPAVAATSPATTAETHPVLDPELHAYCMSRTFDQGPC